MKEFFATRSFVLLVAGATVVATLILTNPPVPAPAQVSLGFWEAAGRGLVTVVTVNETFNEGGHQVTGPAGILVTNAASVPVEIPEEAVLMSPHPSQSPPPNPANTTADAVLTNGTVPAGGSLLYSFGPYVLAGYLAGPIWWDMEEMQFSKAGIAFRIGGETLPFALRTLVEHPFYNGPGNNTQTKVWAYLRSYATVVVGKQPLWAAINGTAGQTVRVRLDATNMAVWATDDTFTGNVNVTKGIVEDDLPAGWSVEGGSFSVPPDLIVNHTDGSQTLEWYAALPAAQVSYQGNPDLPTPYTTVTRWYTLVAPALANGTLTLPRAHSDMNRSGTPDARSALVTIAVTVENAPPIADAGGPYLGKEGDTILLNASKSSDPDGDSLHYRWSYTDNGTWDTNWSSDPTAAVRYTDEFSGHARVAVTDGHATTTARANVAIGNVPPTLRSLTAFASASFHLAVGGTEPGTVTLTVRGNGTVLAILRIVRDPGNPETQSADTGMLAMDLSRPISARLHFSHSDECDRDANPTWVNLTFPDGTTVVLFRTSEARHEDDEEFHVGDLRPLFFRHGITLRAVLDDPGADTLTVHWDFGDGTNLTQVFPNGPANDNPENPVGGKGPVNVTATVVHRFQPSDYHEDESEGDATFVVQLTVTDGDGGWAFGSLTVSQSASEPCHGENDDD